MRQGESTVGLFWDLMQQSQISEQRDRAATIEQRVEQLESRMLHMERLLHDVLRRLETTLGEDLDRDGRIG
jgi:hypothetical protein